MRSSSVKALCFLIFVLVVKVSSQNEVCPFDYLYHLGDGVFDNGNAIANQPYGSQLPAASLSYGETDPGIPTGRWCDGLLDIDYGAQGLGFETITAYLSGNATSSNAIMFAEARSPVLDRQFFTTRGIRIPPYVAPLSVQMSWFRKYLTTICVTPEGPNGNLTLQTCCGTGGNYNYNSRRFCGSSGVPVCADPDQYLFWDGIHLTQEANRRLSIALGAGARPVFGCSVPDSYQLLNSIKSAPRSHQLRKHINQNQLRSSI